ncbi:MAM and LDL-receptor class A domain-containing protein 2-like [Mercenaria mercenaria]|uniref:MAM and LDL-receptor class A domain-containing protein 2-like n=1 Tax=Mercenaria mercenaria TaxID=6596 RepID=UPI00234EF9EF|nr:MAM and LDL-receptor class A domain-containing protein 2-like [Mercenaria mercenaria]
MYGQNIDRLNVYVQSGPSLLTSLIWYKQGNQGNQWMEGNITIKAAKPFMIILEGIRGYGYRGDIAVDDVELTEGSCGSQLTGVPTTFISVSKSADKAILGNNTFAFSCDYIIPLQAHLFAVELQRRRKDDSNFITIVTFQNQSNQINVTYQDTSLESRTEGIQPTTENNSTAGLEFRNIECSDKAEYKCKVYYSDGTNTSIENTTEVVVQASAQTMFSQKGRITYFPNTNITEGDEVVFTCEGDVGSEPEGHIAWFYYLDNDTTNAVDATSNASSTAPVYQENTCTYTRTSMLRLNMTEDINNVTVRCTAQQNVLNQSGDGYVQTNKIPVQLLYSPKIDLIANETYTEGQGTLTLRCTADSYPAPDYVWLLPDGSESLGSNLELTNLTVGSSGLYMCIAHNFFKGENHTTNTTTYVRVEKAPTPITEVITTTPSLIQTTSAKAYYTLKGAIHVVCTNYHWYITVEMDKIRHIYPTARASDIYLGENKCKGVQNGDLLIFQHDLSECLTSELLVNGIEVYNNELIYAEHDPVYLFIVLHYNWTVGVECDIRQNGTAIGRKTMSLSTAAHSKTGTSESSVSQVSCSFDSGLCNWTQDQTDTFDWTRQKGSAPSAYTGPVGDHSGAGYYVYIEASYPRVAGNKARLISPEISPNQQGQNCFTFWYNMYGSNMGRLNVYVQSGPSTSLLWHKKGNQGILWKEGIISIEAAKPFMIILEGIRGNGYAGDIAVDDIKLTEGSCEKQIIG